MKLEICGYVPELHFPKHFSLPFLEGDVFLDLVEGSLKVSGFKVEGFELGETVKHFANKVRHVQYFFKIGSEKYFLDIVLENALVESKYWLTGRTYREHFNDLVEQLREYKKAAKQLGKDKVYLVFGKRGVLSDADFSYYEQELRDALGGDTSWLVIWHGLE